MTGTEAESFRRICRAGGADDRDLYYQGNSSVHPLGACRMGDNSGDIEADRWDSCHDVTGLYICDSSVFPTSGAVNPALTVMAPASRTAHHLVLGCKE
ncbi:MAG: GMC oxidoreductase [Gemmatimonadota bacterium]|nr:GMC oxidoreductase [Gemmatimonadota bacterium]